MGTRKETTSGISKLIWDLENILLETDAADVAQVLYSLEPESFGNLVSQYRGGTTKFYHFDVIGSTDRLTNSSGAATDSYLYDAFGNLSRSAQNRHVIGA